jgi:hypothetical protein
MDLYRLGFKFFAEPAANAADPATCIAVFHRWIQTGALDGLLIDVADYSHVPHGPGVMLIGHEGHYALDGAGGRLGMRFDRKRPMDGTLPERLRRVCRTTLRACRLLEEAPELAGRLTFRGHELEFAASDRLLAANTEDTAKMLVPSLRELLATLYVDADCVLARESDTREPFRVTVSAPQAVGVAALVDRLGG